MASCITSQWGNNYSPQARLTVTQSSSNETTVVLSWTLEYVTHGYTAETNVNKSWSVTIDGSVVDSGTTNINGKTTYTVASGTKTINKQHSSRDVSFSCSFNFDVTWDGTHSDTKTASGSINVGAKTSYVISYNASGGTNAPANQTKWYGETLIITSSVPTKMYYTFKGWGTYPNTTEVVYPAGSSYTNNQEHVLYAVWEATKYSITFDANGGSGAPAKIEYSYSPSGSFVLTGTKPTRTGYTFLGWSLDKNATEPTYYAGQTNWGYFNADAYLLYAVWRQNILTVNYYSNYATEAFSGALNGVGKDKDVIVRTETFLYNTSYEYGLTNYTETYNNTYLAKKGHTAVGYWSNINNIDVDWSNELKSGTPNFIRSGDNIAIWQDYIGFTGQDLAHMLGLALGDGDKTVNLYAQWYIKASRITIYGDDRKPKEGLLHIYYSDVDLATSDDEVITDVDGLDLMTDDGGARYGIIYIYGADKKPHAVI